MKKIVIFFICIYMFAKNDVYVDYVNKIINYNFNLDIQKIHSPFFVPKVELNIKPKVLRKIMKIDLISIFNKKAYIKITTYLGSQIVKTDKKWVKVGDKIANCKIVNINFTSLVLNCGNKKLIKSVDKKIINIKEKK